MSCALLLVKISHQIHGEPTWKPCTALGIFQTKLAGFFVYGRKAQEYRGIVPSQLTYIYICIYIIDWSRSLEDYFFSVILRPWSMAFEVDGGLWGWDGQTSSRKGKGGLPWKNMENHPWKNMVINQQMGVLFPCFKNGKIEWEHWEHDGIFMGFGRVNRENLATGDPWSKPRQIAMKKP